MNKMASQVICRQKQISFLKEAGVDPNSLRVNPGKIDTLLKEGVAYKDKKKRYWAVDNQNCFAIYARGLIIDNSDRSEYWKWTADSSGIEVAEVTNTQWLGVRGSFETRNLSQNVTYKVLFKLKTTGSSTMAGQTVNLKLTLPNGTQEVSKQEKQAALPKGSDQWHELEVGSFQMKPQNIGVMTFAMEQLFDDKKGGLIIERVDIKVG